MTNTKQRGKMTQKQVLSASKWPQQMASMHMMLFQ
jgi:hypothetical protein